VIRCSKRNSEAEKQPPLSYHFHINKAATLSAMRDTRFSSIAVELNRTIKGGTYDLLCMHFSRGTL
jgi:hypothetical protein